MSENLHDLDRRHLWHPYTKFSTLAAGPLPVIVRGEGIHLFDDQGRKYVDAISSWWACHLGHGHPRIIEAIQRQAAQLQHSITANLSHAPAIRLAARLAGMMPTPDRHVLFSSDGASAVEAALKIALQYWHNRGRTGRARFASLEEAYHGDTLGAVSLGYIGRFHRPFDDILFPVYRADPLKGFAPMAAILNEHAEALAAVIVEPLCQGAAGMRMYPPEYLAQLAALCREKDVLLIVDEIATGFGRTGRRFAFEHAGIDPDIVCVGKALTAGYMPLSATIVRDRLYETFGDTPEDHSFYHGHTFSGHPIGAAAALAALDVYEEERVAEAAARLGETLRVPLLGVAGHPRVRQVRVLGAIAAVELDAGDVAAKVRDRLLEENILIRPLGPVVYLMPPLNTPPETAAWLAERLADAIGKACGWGIGSINPGIPPPLRI